MALRLLVFLVLFSGSAQAAGPIERVEPPFWWVGMNQPTLQLLVHGEAIGSFTPTLDHPGVTLETVRRPDSDNYLFLDLSIDPAARPGNLELRFEKDGEVRFTEAYPLHARAEGSAQRPGFDPSDVVYLLMPDRFANGDPDNDTVAGIGDARNRSDPFGRHGGDLQGIIDHLDYFEAIGFTQLWLNPVVENAMPSASYHGYAATDFYTVDPRLGDNQLYAALSAAARERGIGLIQDVVLNHVGSGHYWIEDPPYHDWINFGGEFVATNHRRETLHDPHASESDRKVFSDGWFVQSMPDLNQRNAQLATYLIQNTIWWIEYAGLSGLRVDTYPYSDRAFLSEWSLRVMAEYPNLNITGEEWTNAVPLLAYWQKGAPRYDPEFRSGLPSLLDFPLQEALLLALTEPAGWHTGPMRLYETLSRDFLYADPYNLVTFIDNHDMSRAYTVLNHDIDLLKTALAFVLTTRGIPQVFYGTEVLMANPGSDSHGIIRGDFPGGWPGDSANAFTGEGLTSEQRDVQAYVKALLHWRKSNPAVHRGRLVHYIPSDDVYVYFRAAEGRRTMVALNRSAEARAVALDRFAADLDGATRAVSVPAGLQQSLGETLDLPPKSATILDLE